LLTWNALSAKNCEKSEPRGRVRGRVDLISQGEVKTRGGRQADTVNIWRWTGEKVPKKKKKIANKGKKINRYVLGILFLGRRNTRNGGH